MFSCGTARLLSRLHARRGGQASALVHLPALGRCARAHASGLARQPSRIVLRGGRAWAVGKWPLSAETREWAQARTFLLKTDIAAALPRAGLRPASARRPAAAAAPPRAVCSLWQSPRPRRADALLPPRLESPTPTHPPYAHTPTPLLQPHRPARPARAPRARADAPGARRSPPPPPTPARARPRPRAGRIRPRAAFPERRHARDRANARSSSEAVQRP